MFLPSYSCNSTVVQCYTRCAASPAYPRILLPSASGAFVLFHQRPCMRNSRSVCRRRPLIWRNESLRRPRVVSAWSGDREMLCSTHLALPPAATQGAKVSRELSLLPRPWCSTNNKREAISLLKTLPRRSLVRSGSSLNVKSEGITSVTISVSKLILGRSPSHPSARLRPLHDYLLSR